MEKMTGAIQKPRIGHPVSPGDWQTVCQIERKESHK